jgi:integrase
MNEARALLEGATPEFVPIIALGLFAGLRPEAEVWRLDWSHIDLDAREIDVQKSKNLASYRFVKISDNLAAWLKPHAKKKGPLWLLQDEAFFRRMREIRERAAAKLEADGKDADNLREWPSDCLRHSFASYTYALKGAEYTAKELGHGGKLDLLHRRYGNRVRETEALAFWQILPASAAVPFSVEAA